MIKWIMLLFFSTTGLFSLIAQQNPVSGLAYRVEYRHYNHGKPVSDRQPTEVWAGRGQTLVTVKKNPESPRPYPFEFFSVNYSDSLQTLYALLNDSTVISTVDSGAINRQQFNFIADQKIILGYRCRHARTVVNSNTIDIWYTTELSVKGAPSVLGQSLGLVLETIRNGSSSQRAVAIEKTEVHWPVNLSSLQVTPLDLLSYRDRIWRSRFQTIPLFTHQVINFSDSVFANSPGFYRFAHGTVVVKKVRLPKLADKSSIFLELRERSNGDAYDRTGSVFLIPTDKKLSFLDALRDSIDVLPVYENGNGKKYQGILANPDYQPAVELMRFFTPFGIGAYDHIRLKDKNWYQTVLYRQDISDFKSMMSGQEVYIGVFIGNYDKGGHIIDAEITLHPGGDSGPASVLPLFNTLNLMEMAGQEYATLFDSDEGLQMTFELKTPLKNAVLRYTSTGHGGWGGGDEFQQKVNHIFLDGQEIFQLIPWRQDCGSYRLMNPASGNFSNGLSSSDYSRSNWCPGTVTNPYFIPLGDLKAGQHQLQIKIPQGAPDGSSFSAWNISGVLLGNPANAESGSRAE